MGSDRSYPNFINNLTPFFIPKTPLNRTFLGQK